MAHEGVFATSDEILVRAGENVDATGATEVRINDLASQSESIINCITRFNWSDAYAGLNADVKRILSSASAAWCAVHLVSFNMNGYTTRVEAEDMINVQRDSFLRDVGLLRDKKVKEFMDGA
jgi:hypothetical protein|tara:strand:- start:1695 stop:2060 length:366 start_codon:yes stop_codon:yes gene_type:complete